MLRFYPCNTLLGHSTVYNQFIAYIHETFSCGEIIHTQFSLHLNAFKNTCEAAMPYVVCGGKSRVKGRYIAHLLGKRAAAH